MANTGSLVSKLSDSPITEAVMNSLEEHDSTHSIIPVLSRFEGDTEVYHHFTIWFESGESIILGYFPKDGWTVQDRLQQKEHESNEEYFERLSFAGQMYSYSVMEAIDYYPAPESIEGSLVSGPSDCPDPGEVSQGFDW